MKVPSSNLICEMFSTRTLYDMKDVLCDTEWLRCQKNKDLYFMYRQTHASENDLEKMKAAGLRYDITIIPPGKLGEEYNKTYGHYHPLSPSKIAYPEVYQVLKGNAVYVLQKEDMKQFVVTEASKGDIVLIPPGYGHVTINRYEEELVAANWVSDLFTSDYDLIKQKRGFMYYMTEEGFIKNKCYEKHPQITYEDPKDISKIGLESGKDMYSLIKTLDTLDFLNRPELLNALNP